MSQPGADARHVRRDARPVRPGGRRAPWILLGVAAIAAAVIAAGTLIERGEPAADHTAVPTWQPATPTATTAQPSSQPATVASPPATPARTAIRHYAFPVTGTVSYARTHHDYPATDIIASCGATVRAATDGVVLEVNRTDSYDPRTDDGADRGGLYVSILGDDGVRYYGSHLQSVAKGIDRNVRVRAGQALGRVGESGDASVCHLHFGISPSCGRIGDWWIRRGTVWPWPFLDSWRSGGSASPVATVTAWHTTHGCPPVTAVADQ